MTSPNQQHRSCSGFTIIEVVVVLGIISILAAILIPSIAGIRHRAIVATDVLNLRSLQIAHYQYAVDEDGKFADAGLAHGGLANEEIAWLNLVGEYVDLDGVIRSPLDTSPHWETPVEGTTNRFRRTSYGWNNYLSRTHSPDAAIDPRQAVDRMSKLKNPAKTVHFLHMAATGSFAGADHVHVENWWIGDSHPDAPPVLASNQVQTNAVSGKPHSSQAKSNYGFVDGHVETRHFFDVYVDPNRNSFNPEIAPLF